MISSPAINRGGGMSAPRPTASIAFPMPLVARDKVNLDIFWLRDDTLDDPDLLPPPDEIAAEIVENLEAALDRFRKVSLSLQSGGTVVRKTYFVQKNCTM